MSAKSNYKSPYKKKRVEHSTIVTGYLMAYDVLAVSLAYFLALLVRFDLRFTYIPTLYLEPWLKFAPFYAIICLLVFWRLRLYKSIWRFASFKELQRITLATIVTTAVHILGIMTTLYILSQGAAYSVSRMPFSYFLMGPIIQFFLITGVRFSYRFILLMRANNKKKASKNVMVIGAGAAGLQIIREIQHSPAVKEHVVCIIDDNPNKWNREIEGIPVVGGRGRILEAAVDYDIDKIYITIPSVTNQEKRKILDICKDTDCELMMLPGMYQIALGNVSVSNLKKVDVEDLLGREPVKMNSKPVRNFLSEKVVLVTGGGGSIGSELCRQVAAVKGLKQLIIFDIYENNAHAIRLELEDKYPDLNLVVLIGSVRDNRRVKEIFRDYRPNVVFHAAAHKHVPLMEDSPCEAIKNNVIGTYVTAYSAMIYGCEHFVLISTDKAVNPVNIMGASKRLCEMVVQTFAKKIAEGKAIELPDLYAHAKSSSEIPVHPVLPDYPTTQFAAVRFGNVLGSNGSVIPRFREQIAAGGPVTVTHPDIIRYFMTIPEAASLVLQAAAFGNGGRIYVLDMGTPVKIDDLARNMIKLSGLRPDEDIQVVYTGLRPGEKLYEERLMDEEGMQTTSNELINIGSPIPFEEDLFLQQLPPLVEAAFGNREDLIRNMVADIVETYHPAGRHGQEKKDRTYMELRQTMDVNT